MEQISETSQFDFGGNLGPAEAHILQVHPCSLADPHAHTRQIRRALLRARRALLHLRLREVSKALARTRNLLSSGGPKLVARYCDALIQLRACVLIVEDDLPRARELLLTSTRVDNSGSLANTLLRYIDWMSGADTEPPVLERAQDASTSTRGPTLERILRLCVHAAFEFEHLRPTVAANLANEALRLATERYGVNAPPSCLPAVLLAQIAYEQGRLTEAELLIRARWTTIRATGVLECVLRASIVLARLAVHQGRSIEASEILRDAETIGRSRGWTRLTQAARAEHSRILSATTHRTRLEDAVPHQASELNSIRHTDRCDVAVAPRYSALQAALSKVVSAPPCAHPEDLYRFLISCLRIGATRGFYRVFVDAGMPMQRLLRNLSQYPHLLEEPAFSLGSYISLILRDSPSSASHVPRGMTNCRPPALSRREVAILRMIAEGMTNKQIAQSLGIAPETVKSHARNIQIKLGTRTRAQAVAHATSMDLC